MIGSPEIFIGSTLGWVRLKCRERTDPTEWFFSRRTSLNREGWRLTLALGKFDASLPDRGLYSSILPRSEITVNFGCCTRKRVVFLILAPYTPLPDRHLLCEGRHTIEKVSLRVSCLFSLRSAKVVRRQVRNIQIRCTVTRSSFDPLDCVTRTGRKCYL